MKARDEYVFTGLGQDLKDEFKKIHNDICKSLVSLKGLTNADVGNYIQSLLDLLELNSPREKNIICLTLKEVNDVKSLGGVNKYSEDLEYKKLTFLPEYKRKEDEITKINSKPSKDNSDEEKLVSWGKKLNSKKSIKSVLLSIFNYSGRRRELLKFYKDQEQINCGYCLAQYTSVYSSESNKNLYLTGNLDHIHAKDRYPFLSFTINNLLPVCAHCNQRKSSSSFGFNPFDKSHNHSFQFAKCLEIRNGEVTLKSLDNLSFNPPKGVSLVEKLDLKDLYAKFNKDALNIVSRFSKFYSEGYKHNVAGFFSDDENESNLDYFVSEIPMLESNELKYPLLKFKKELFEELKLIKSKNDSKVD